MPAPPEHALADYALALKYGDLDEASQEWVADIIVDTIGIAIGAYVTRQRSGLICEDNVLESVSTDADGRPNATLWSGRGLLAPDIAALCNGTWAEVLDYQDTVVDARNNGHAAVTIVPAAVAVAETVAASGRDLVVAVAAGLETTIAILRAVGRAHRAEGRGFRTTSIAAPVGAALACAKLLGLDRTGMLNAAGIAGASAPNGLMPSLSPVNGAFGMDKDFVNGLAAQLAVNAAQLAGRGMTGSDAVVTGDRGIVASHAHGDAWPLEVPAGGTPNIRLVSLKKFAACYGVHTAMEAAQSLCAEHGLSDPDRIRHVTVAVKADSATTLGGRVITNHMAARFSLPYGVATAIVRGAASGMSDFDDPAIRDPIILAFMDRISIEPDAAMTEFHQRTGGFPAQVTIEADGKRYERRIDYPPGSFERPMARSELDAKFRELTDGRWPRARQREVMATARRLAALQNVRELTRLF